MKYVVQETTPLKKNKIAVRDVPPPQVAADTVLVATEASLISAGTDKAALEQNISLGTGKQNLAELMQKMAGRIQREGLFAGVTRAFSEGEYPQPIGASAAGRVVAVGAKYAQQFRPGMQVSIAGFGVAKHAELNAVPASHLAIIPENISMEAAAFAPMAVTALRAFEQGEAGLGQRVLVMGLGVTGQLVAQIACHAGCRVAVVDYDTERLAAAEAAGVKQAYDMADSHLEKQLETLTEGQGFDAIYLCLTSDNDKPLRHAAAWAAHKARVIVVGQLPLHLAAKTAAEKEITLRVVKKYNAAWGAKEQAHMREALRLMQEGALDIQPLISHTYPIDDAEEAYALVAGNSVPHLGVLLTYGRSDTARTAARVTLQPTTTGTDEIGLGVVGVGAFTAAVTLPLLKKCRDVHLTGVASQSGLSAQEKGKRFGFSFAADGLQEVLSHAATHAVFLATPAETHAEMVVQALEAGKHVLVQNPLALTKQSLKRIESVAETAGKVLMVAYPWRASPYTVALKDSFHAVTSPKQVLMRVNVPHAGHLQEEENGITRLLEAMAPSLDLVIHVVGHRVKTVQAVRGEGGLNIAITLTFTDGSIATLLHSAEGDTATSCERLEIYGGGMVGIIDGFKKGWLMRDGKTKRIRPQMSWKEKAFSLLTPAYPSGQKELLRTFIDAVKGETEAPALASAFHTTEVALLACESLQAQNVKALAA